jgi:hypothetical protein
MFPKVAGTEQIGLVATFQSCIQKVLSLNFIWVTSHVTEALRGFSGSPKQLPRKRLN